MTPDQDSSHLPKRTATNDQNPLADDDQPVDMDDTTGSNGGPASTRSSDDDDDTDDSQRSPIQPSRSDTSRVEGTGVSGDTNSSQSGGRSQY